MSPSIRIWFFYNLFIIFDLKKLDLKSIILICLPLLLLISCRCPDEKNTESRFLLNLKINTGSFASAGYKHIKIQEYDRIIDQDLSQFYVQLPIALNQPNSTFIFYGDSIADTLQIANYSIQPVLHSGYCGYQLQLSEPEVSYSTFSGFNITSFDISNYNLNVNIYP